MATPIDTAKTWVVTKDSDKSILDEIFTQTDRGAALIAAAYLEERLIGAIQARMNRNETIEGRFFRGSGPLAAFSTKIDLGLLLGIYDLNTHKLLRTVKDIRNDFAHKPEPRDFNTQKIRALCLNIDIKGRAEFVLKPPGQEVQKMELSFVSDDTPKTAFLNAVRFLLMALDMEINIVPPRTPAPPVVPPLSKPKASTGKS